MNREVGESNRMRRRGGSAMSRILNLDELCDFRDEVRKMGKTVGSTNGCFDIFHAGHLHVLETMANEVDVIVVGVNGDASVHRLKGSGRPVFPEQDRASLLASLRVVDRVHVFEEDTPVSWLRALEPDIHYKGGDYTVDELPESQVVRSGGGIVRIVDLLPERSTTAALSRAVNEATRHSKITKEV